ncbi:MAG: hypothetical protein ACE5QF_04440 [Thermoplasmata archaeon]
MREVRGALAPQFSVRHLQPPQSYRSRQYATRKPPEPPYPAYQYYPPIFIGPRSAGSFPTEEAAAGRFGYSSLLLGIASVVPGLNGFMLPLVGVVLGILAIPLGSVALHRREKHGMTGIALGVLGLILGLLWISHMGDLFFGISP